MNLDYRITVLICSLILSAYGYSPSKCTICKATTTCKPPNCFCCSDEMPLAREDIPQMVFFTFDDAITPQVAGFYRQLFDSSRRNPNGCPISMTLFISHSNTVYSLVREFYQKGMEIASHSVSHGHPKASTFRDEAMKQKQNLARMARIPHTRIKGWRSPFLEPLGDAQPNTLQDLGYAYDATLTISKKNLMENPAIPFTLDYGWPYDCKIKPCPKRRHQGFWEVPVISLMDYLQRFDCVYVDGCNNPPPDEEAAFRFLWDNFQSYYKTNKAPFGVNMHASWFFYPDRLKAMDRFIDELVRMDDVFIVNVKQVIEWLRNPVKLLDIQNFQPWSCDSSNGTSSGSQTAFDLRNKQIEQRLKELRQQRFEKQEMEFLQKQRSWAMQEAARKAAAKHKYLPPRVHTPQNDNRKSAPSNRSPAMTWQQMLLFHAKKQHALALERTKATQKNIQTVQTIQAAPKRMVRPVNKLGDPRQREIMLKEQRRIREQQRIAAENRLKQSSHQEPSSSSSKHHTKETEQKVNTATLNSVKQNIAKDKNNEQIKVALQKTKQQTVNQNKVAKHNVKVPMGPPKNVVIMPFKRKSLLRISNQIDIKQNGRNPLASVKKTIPITHRIQKPMLQLAVHKPVKKERIQPETPTTTVKPAITTTPTKEKRIKKLKATHHQNQPTTQKVQFVGGSWASKLGETKFKIPWRRWMQDYTQNNKPKATTNKSVIKKTKQSFQTRKNSTPPQTKHLGKVETGKVPTTSAKKDEPEKSKKTTLVKNQSKNSFDLLDNNKSVKHTTEVSDSNITMAENSVKPAINLTRTGHKPSVSELNRCQKDVNCFLPDCFCMTSQNTFDIRTSDIPQMVFITFEGDINFLSYSKMRSLFNTNKMNPNGCPIGSTFFVSEEGTSYSLARNLQRYGTEIAMNGLKRNGYDNVESFKADFDQQMSNIEKRIGNINGMTGWRNPSLKILGDKQFQVLQNKSNIYDSSIVLDRSMKSFPFTLDFGLKQFCIDQKSCDLGTHKGVWEIPIVPLHNFNQSDPCIYADDCKIQPSSTEETYQYLLKNFEKYYYLNRAPFGLHFKQKWFHWSFSKNLAGLSKFLDKILAKSDVYVVTISDMLKWMKNPTKISELDSSGIWQC